MIYIASDHGGYELKNFIVNYLQSKKIAFKDMGTNSPSSVDFPVYANKVTNAMLKSKTKTNFGILICGSGIGISIAANRVPGIRAALIPPCTHAVEYARLARQHNNANVIALGGRFTTPETAIAAIDAFLATPADPDPKYKARMDAVG